MKETMLLQRRILGILCACLAPACIIFGLFGDNLPLWYCSISATYYANSKMCMIGLLFATGVFFFSYKGYDWKDRLLSIIQAVSSWGIVMFPCETPAIPERVGLFNLPVPVSHVIHCIFASVLFISFAVNIAFIFTLGNSNNPMKKKRNFVYRICAIVMAVFIVLQGISGFLKFIPEWFPLTLINEAVILEAFAVAWLVKSGMFFNDRIC